MTVGFYLYSSDGNSAAISKSGELFTSPISYSTGISKTLDTINTGFNLVKPKNGHRIAITSIVVYGNKDVGVNDATVEIYSANSVSSTTVIKSIFKIEVVKQNPPIVLSGINFITDSGVWLNAKTNDATVFIVVGAHYLPDLVKTDLLIE